MTRRVPLALAALLLAGCSAPGEPPTVRVQAGPQDLEVAPTQYCLDGEGWDRSATPPVVEVSPDTTVTLTVPREVAERGWEVQVFDETLQQEIGVVEVPEGERVFDGINSSDVALPAFYLVVVQDSGDGCSGLSGAWPVGFLRAGGDLGGPPPASPGAAG